MEKNKIDIKELFKGLQDNMMQGLNLTRANIPHAPSKGDASENEWIKWLETYLPKRYKVDKAFAIDHEGSLSEQMDVVIYDRQYSPFVFHQNGVKYIPAESIYAIFEVKQELNKENLDYAAKKVVSVRNLKRTSASIVHAGGKIVKPKEPFKIIGGILTTESGWNPPLGKSFEELIMAQSENGFLDIGCSIKDGSFITGEADGERTLRKSEPDEVLIFFFTTLLHLLQQKGTVPALDIMEYAKALKSI